MRETTGILCIGDPHLASRVPGLRKDEYPRVILAKLAWSLDYARIHGLMPVILGDLFHFPRDNANWLLVELLDLLRDAPLAVAGNHDCNENELTPDDTLSILAAAGRLRLLDRTGPWQGILGGNPALIGGTCWGQPLPRSVDRGDARLVVWLAHHDIRFPGYEESGRLGCREIPGVDLLVNGHIHRPLPEVRCGMTTWLNPGNISRVSRGDTSRQRKPGVLRIDVGPEGWQATAVDVPHQPFDEVFHPDIESEPVVLGESLFIRGLAQLEMIKTGGAGLQAFLDQNLGQFEPDVAAEVRCLAEEVLHGDDTV